MTPPVTPRTCDRSDCPALAQRVYLIYDQHFHFCTHHGVELERTCSATTPIIRVVTPRDEAVARRSDAASHEPRAPRRRATDLSWP